MLRMTRRDEPCLETMPNPGKPDPYRVVLEQLKRHPIKKWAYSEAGISRQSLYAKMDRDPDLRGAGLGGRWR